MVCLGIKKGALLAPDFNMVPLEVGAWNDFVDRINKIYTILNS